LLITENKTIVLKLNFKILTCINVLAAICAHVVLNIVVMSAQNASRLYAKTS